jgi:hypothetical protein
MWPDYNPAPLFGGFFFLIEGMNNNHAFADGIKNSLGIKGGDFPAKQI